MERVDYNSSSASKGQAFSSELDSEVTTCISHTAALSQSKSKQVANPVGTHGPEVTGPGQVGLAGPWWECESGQLYFEELGHNPNSQALPFVSATGGRKQRKSSPVPHTPLRLNRDT